MATNTFTFNPQAGTISAVSNVLVSREHTCACGTNFTFTLEWPENLTQQGAISINGATCPSCQQPIHLPKGRYWAENFELRSEPLPE